MNKQKGGFTNMPVEHNSQDEFIAANLSNNWN